MSLSANENSLHPLQKTQVRLQVFEQMKTQIITGVWKPGDKIPSENELSRQMGVSRISVREALQKLVALDLLETKHGEGTFVKQLSADLYINSLIPMMYLSKDDIIDVLEYRRIMEKGIIGLAVERAEPEDIIELRDLLLNMKKTTNDMEKFAVYDLGFHLKLARMTHNPIFIKINNIIKDILSSAMMGALTPPGAERGVYHHTRLLEAIERGDKKLAQDSMEELIDDVITCVLDQKEALEQKK